MNPVLQLLLQQANSGPQEDLSMLERVEERGDWKAQESSATQSQKSQDQSVGLEKGNQEQQSVFILHTQSDVRVGECAEKESGDGFKNE